MQLISAQAADRSILGLPPAPPAAAAPGIFASVRQARVALLRTSADFCLRRAASYGMKRDAAPPASMLRCFLHAKQHGWAAQAAAYQAMVEDRDADAKEAFAVSDEAFLRASDLRALAWPA